MGNPARLWGRLTCHGGQSGACRTGIDNSAISMHVLILYTLALAYKCAPIRSIQLTRCSAHLTASRGNSSSKRASSVGGSGRTDARSAVLPFLQCHIDQCLLFSDERDLTRSKRRRCITTPNLPISGSITKRTAATYQSRRLLPLPKTSAAGTLLHKTLLTPQNANGQGTNRSVFPSPNVS
jgi:hypothetical protein